MASPSSSVRAVKHGRHDSDNDLSVLDRITSSNTLLILACAIPGLISCLILLFLSSSYDPVPIPLFDASPDLINVDKSPFVRWDAVHFLPVAAGGYRYEQQLAFQPGWHATLAIIGRAWQFIFGTRSIETAIATASIPFMILLAGIRGCLLFRLTESMLNRRIAIISTSLYLFAPTPAVLVSPYTEPLYATFTFGGYLLAHRRRYFLASLSLAGATSLRATGVFTAPLLACLAIFQEGIYRLPIKVIVRRAASVALPCVIVVLPFLAFQLYSYLAFCTPEPTRPWCHSRVPLAYSFVQAEYWNVGFLNYWTPAQIPNLLIASPVLSISIMGIHRFITSQSHIPTRLAPMVVHHGVMTFLLIFGSHTQIALRVISTDPVSWWLLADASFNNEKEKRNGMGNAEWEMTRLGRAWLYWTVVWGAVSTVLWAGHYPPA